MKKFVCTWIGIPFLQSYNKFRIIVKKSYDCTITKIEQQIFYLNISENFPLTYVVPNYFIENSYSNFRQIHNLYTLNYITKYQDNSVYARTTMHSLGIVLEGEKVVHINGDDVHIRQGEIFLLTQNNYYMSERMTNNQHYKSMLIYFNDQFIIDFIQKYHISLNTSKSKAMAKLRYKHEHAFKSTVEQTQHYIESNFDDNLTQLKIEELFLHALRLEPTQMHAFFHAILSTSQDRITYILESNIDVIETLSDMCRFTQLSESKIRRYIKQKYNLTPKTWLDNRRLQKATMLLESSDKSISEIATECGYATISWFIAQFKKQYQVTPKEFRQKM